MIVTANYWYRFAQPPIPDWQTYWLSIVAPQLGRHGLPIYTDIVADIICIANVNRGRWIVVCPFGCGGAERAWEEGLFYCLSCFNSGTKHQTIRSQFPAQRLQIEALLEPRPWENRNWNLSESLEDLIHENREHNLPGEVA